MAKTHGQLRPKGFRREGVSGLLRIPVVEFVCRDGSARAAEQVVPLGRQRDVAKACELPGETYTQTSVYAFEMNKEGRSYVRNRRKTQDKTIGHE